MPGRGVRVITKFARRIHDPASRVVRDLDVGSLVEHERDGRPGDTGQGRYVGAGGTLWHALSRFASSCRRRPCALRLDRAARLVDTDAALGATKVSRVSNAYQ